ncbi:hypothetical protein MAHJHV57_49870 [Mycobacterium avium subsp. hominissuis]
MIRWWLAGVAAMAAVCVVAPASHQRIIGSAPRVLAQQHSAEQDSGYRAGAAPGYVSPAALCIAIHL